MLFWIVTGFVIAAALFILLVGWCALRSGALYDQRMDTFKFHNRNRRANQHQENMAMTTENDSRRAAAVVLCAKLEDLNTAIVNSRADIEYGTVPCPICDNQADNLALTITRDAGAVLCATCLKASII